MPDKPNQLYHLMHRTFEGEVLQPNQANDEDNRPYIYASSSLVETLPFATPNGTRLYNAAIPGTDLYLTIIPDRDNFLKNKKMQGMLYKLPADNFFSHPRHETQFVSEKPVPKVQIEMVAQVNGIEDAMRLGLQVIFTNGPLTDDVYQTVKDIVSDPEFSANLRYYIDIGFFTYENKERNIQPISYLASELETPSVPSKSAPSSLKPPLFTR